MDEPIEIFNWARILLNEQTPGFILEVAFRTTMVMIMGLFFVRLLGKKAVNQFSAFEFLIIVMWGTVIGDPTFYENVALLWSLTVLTVGTIFYRSFQFLTRKYSVFGNILEGKTTLIIEDGVLDVASIKKQVISIDDIKSLLRTEGIRSFGEIEKAYLERSGKISVFKKTKSDYGLPTDPSHSKLIDSFKSGELVPSEGLYSENESGRTIKLEKGKTFPPNEKGLWIKSV